MVKIELPYEVKRIIELLETRGFEAYAVGGCVRDSLLLRRPDDWDITTDATPDEVRQIFNKTIDTGIAHGTVTVRMHGQSFEVTTYRIDGDYSDGRHPDEVQFTPNLQEDLKRRDFTINAMAYHPVRGLVDLFGGREDLQERRIRCVGDPVERFGEDALRMLRALRFSAQLDFAVDEDIFAAIRRLHQTIAKVSAERIQTEMVKLLVSEHPERMQDVYESGLSATFLPEWDVLFDTPQNTAHHMADVGRHTAKVLQALPQDRVLRLAGLLHDIGKPLSRKTDEKGIDHFVGHPQVGERMAKKILRRLKFDNDTVYKVARLVRFHDERPMPSARNVRRLAARVGKDAMEPLFALKRADIAGQSDFHREEKLAEVDALEMFYREILAQEDCLTLKDLAIDGTALMNLGVPKGPEIGQLLKALLAEVVDEPERNTEAYLKKRAKELL